VERIPGTDVATAALSEKTQDTKHKHSGREKKGNKKGGGLKWTVQQQYFILLPTCVFYY
jgi:hypothetical protein